MRPKDFILRFKAVLKCLVSNGAQYVMTLSAILTLKSFADHLVSLGLNPRLFTASGNMEIEIS